MQGRALFKDLLNGQRSFCFSTGLSKIVSTATFQPHEVRRVPNIYSNSLPIGRARMRQVVEMILLMHDSFELPYIPSE